MPAGFWDWDYVRRFLPFFLEGAALTLRLALLALALGSAVGLVLALMELSGSRWLRAPAHVYIELFRSTPLIVQIFIAGFAVPYMLGYTPDPLRHGVAALSLNAGAYTSQIFRASIAAVEAGQMEAARSLGMTYAQAMRYVILPQALRVAVPPMTNEFIALLKDTALLFALGIPELLTRARLMSGRYARPQEAFLTAAAIYLVMTLPLSQLARYLEQRLARGERRAA